MPRRLIFFWLFLCFFNNKSLAQIDTVLFKKRVSLLAVSAPLLYVGSMSALYLAWYKDYPQTNFHFFDDNAEWKKMDKVCHVMAAYTISYGSYKACKWAGLNSKQSKKWSLIAGLSYPTVIEILDGFSAGWGASWGDFTANVAGSLMFIVQQHYWEKQRIILRYSYSETPEPIYRPLLLGNNLQQRLIKNYNGITIWASFNISSFLPKQNLWPQWLDLSLGYGISGMTGAKRNPSIVNGVLIPEFNRRKHFYLSPDVRLSNLPIKNKNITNFLKIFDFVKIPMPAISFSPNEGFKGHWLMF